MTDLRPSPPRLAPIAEYFDRSAVPSAPDPPTAAAPITPDHKNEARRAYRETRTAIALLQQRWPAAFPEAPQQVRPLITRLTSLVAAALGWSHPYTRAVLRTWKLRPAYCHAVLAQGLSQNFPRPIYKGIALCWTYIDPTMSRNTGV